MKKISKAVSSASSVSISRASIDAVVNLLTSAENGVNIAPIVEDLVSGGTDRSIASLNVALCLSGHAPKPQPREAVLTSAIDTEGTYKWGRSTKVLIWESESVLLGTINAKAFNVDYYESGSENANAGKFSVHSVELVSLSVSEWEGYVHEWNAMEKVLIDAVANRNDASPEMWEPFSQIQQVECAE